jgi:hypothetical protein
MAFTDLVGVGIPRSVLVIERGPVEQFARSVLESHPAYFSEPTAAALGFGNIPLPPTFLFSAEHWGTFREGQPPDDPAARTLVELIAALRGGRPGLVLHGGQQFEYHRQVWVGDVLDVEGIVESVEEKPGTAEKPGMSVLVVRTEYRRRQTAELAVTTRSTFLFRPSVR